MRCKYLPLLGGLFALLICVGAAEAGVATNESPVVEVYPSTGPACINIATHSWTHWPPATVGNFSRRNGATIFTDSPTDMGYISNMSATAPSGATNRYDKSLKSKLHQDIQPADNIHLWFISLSTGPEVLCGQEYRQR